MLSEAQIIEGCKKYNCNAQKLLYEKYAPVLRGICYRYVNDHQTVKDILQDGFLKVFSKINQYKGEGSFEGWMKRIFINTTISHLKKNKKFFIHSDISDVREINIISDTAASDNEMEKNVDYKDIDKKNIDYNLIKNAEFSKEEMLEALKAVPEIFRVVFNLYALEDYAHKEIAEVLNIDENTSRTRLLRAKKIIQDELYQMSIRKLGK